MLITLTYLVNQDKWPVSSCDNFVIYHFVFYLCRHVGITENDWDRIIIIIGDCFSASQWGWSENTVPSSACLYLHIYIEIGQNVDVTHWLYSFTPLAYKIMIKKINWWWFYHNDFIPPTCWVFSIYNTFLNCQHIKPIYNKWWQKPTEMTMVAIWYVL